MAYLRVIPRDLFNEANLLKCLGRIYINLENMARVENCVLVHDDEAFDIDQNEATGGLFVRNVWLRAHGKDYYFERPLNSRREWPLYMSTEGDDIEVFGDEGQFSDEMVAFLLGVDA